MSVDKKPYGNLSFEDYTFSTDAEKLVVALQAAMKVRGYTEKSPSWKKLQRMKKAMKKDKRYTFDLLPKDKVSVTPTEKVGPEHDLSPLLAEVIANCLGVKLRKISTKNTSAGYAVVTAICVGLLSDLRIPPGVDSGPSPRIVTEALFKKEVEERCFTRDKRFSSVSVMSVRVKKSKKKKHCLVSVEAFYK